MNAVKQFIWMMTSFKFSLNKESELKDEMERMMCYHRIPFAREKSLDKKNRPDFILDEYAVEVKIRGESATAIYRQCARYAAFPEVKGIILVTNKAQGLPDTICGKPAYYVSLGKSWL